jgi:molecular chaperone DnaK
LDKTEVEKMAKDAEAHAEEDKAKKEAVEARNLLDSAVYQAEKLKNDNGDKLADEDMKTLNEAIDEAKKTVNKADATKDELEKAAKELNDKLMPIGAKMYEQAAAETPDEDKADDADANKKADDPIEGEVVDDKKA